MPKQQRGDGVPDKHSFGVSHRFDRAATPRTAVVVLGMHRSGTSALTRTLSLAGFALPRRLLSGSGDNLEGFWESPAVVALNERVLAVLSRLPPDSGPATPDAGQPDEGSEDSVYEGHLDCLVGTVLYGWCWKQSSGDRVPLRLDLDQRDCGRAVASQFRDDLYASAIGDGWHAFAIDLAGQADMRDDAVARVLTEDSVFVLPGSGRTVAELRQVG